MATLLKLACSVWSIRRQVLTGCSYDADMMPCVSVDLLLGSIQQLCKELGLNDNHCQRSESSTYSDVAMSPISFPGVGFPIPNYL